MSRSSRATSPPRDRRTTLAISAFGGRQELYERFYGGDPFALCSSFWFNQFGWSGPDRLVDDCLAAFDVQTALKATQSQ